MIQEGSSAPDFTLQSDDGTDFMLSKNKGKIIILYFYPKDNTSG